MSDEFNFESYESMANLVTEAASTDSLQAEPVASETTTESGTQEVEQSKDVLDLLDKVEVSKEEEKPENSFLDEINKLGLTRNDQPLKYETKEQVVEALQKWKDYESKTSELKQEREKYENDYKSRVSQFEASQKEFEAAKLEHATKLTEYDIFEQALLSLQRDEPEAFDLVSNYFRNQARSYQQVSNNPETLRLKNEISQMREEFNKIKQSESEKEKVSIRSGYEQDYSKLVTQYGAKLKDLGITLKPDEIKSIWAADASGKMDVASAFRAVHGAEIEKALTARAKLAETKLKSMSRQGTPKAQKKEEVTGGVVPNVHSFEERIKEIASKYI